MNNIQYWSLNSVLCLALFSGLTVWEKHHQELRKPASSDMLSLEIKEIQLPSGSKLHELRNVGLRATFNQEQSMDLLPGRTLNLSQGQAAQIDVKIPVSPTWIRNDQLAFTLEFVQRGFLESVVVRCTQISKKISHYNRNYQCFIPGDTAPLVTYRLGNDQVGVSTLAQK
jgi:hypothetical protein